MSPPSVPAPAPAVSRYERPLKVFAGELANALSASREEPDPFSDLPGLVEDELKEPLDLSDRSMEIDVAKITMAADGSYFRITVAAKDEVAYRAATPEAPATLGEAVAALLGCTKATYRLGDASEATSSIMYRSWLVVKT